MKKVSFWLLCGAAAATTAATVVACGDSNNDNGQATKGTDPSTIASDNLVVYLPFEDNTAAKGDLTLVKNEGITFVDGQRGKCYQGAEGGYIKYALPADSKLKTLKAVSFAAWVKLKPNTPSTPDNNTNAPEYWLAFLDQAPNSDWQGNWFVGQKRNSGADGAEVNIAGLQARVYKDDATTTSGDAGWKSQSASSFTTSALTYNKWHHVVLSYNNTTSEYEFYLNGAKVTVVDGDGNPVDWMKRWQESDEAGDARRPLGDLKFVGAENLYLGALANKVSGTLPDAWAGYFKGQMDEVRIYDKALTATEVDALFKAELSQTPEE